MAKFSLNKEMNLEVKARFISKGTDSALTDAYTVRLYDKDFFEDDFLGEARLDENGEVKITFTLKAFSDTLHTDDMPDLYFVLYKNKEEVFKTKVLNNVNIEALKNFETGEGKIIDLGTYLVEA